jgi:hypothetical protein
MLPVEGALPARHACQLQDEHVKLQISQDMALAWLITFAIVTEVERKTHFQEGEDGCLRPHIKSILCGDADSLLKLSEVYRCDGGDDVESREHALAIRASQLRKKHQD